MANLTIKQLDERILDRLRAQARKKNLSLNAYLKDELAKLIGLQPGVKTYSDLSDLAGCWTEEEAEEFSKNTEQFTRIDEELWK